MDINIRVTGLDKLAEGLIAFASAQKEVVNAVQYQATPEHPTPNPAPVNAPGPSPVPGEGVPAKSSNATAYTAPPALVPPQAPISAPVNHAPITNPAPTAPAAAPAYTLNDIAQPAGAWLSADPAKQAERSSALTALNMEFGIEGLNQLAPEQYGAYALRLRAMGVCI